MKKSRAAAIASVFQSKAETSAQAATEARTAEWVQHDYGRCPVCEEISEEPHLHGAKLFQGGRELF